MLSAAQIRLCLDRLGLGDTFAKPDARKMEPRPADRARLLAHSPFLCSRDLSKMRLSPPSFLESNSRKSAVAGRGIVAQAAEQQACQAIEAEQFAQNELSGDLGLTQKHYHRFRSRDPCGGAVDLLERLDSSPTAAWPMPVGAAAAAEKYFNPLQLPNEIRIRSCGLIRFNSASWAKLPPKGPEGTVQPQAPASRQQSASSASLSQFRKPYKAAGVSPRIRPLAPASGTSSSSHASVCASGWRIGVCGHHVGPLRAPEQLFRRKFLQQPTLRCLRPIIWTAPDPDSFTQTSAPAASARSLSRRIPSRIAGAVRESEVSEHQAMAVGQVQFYEALSSFDSAGLKGREMAAARRPPPRKSGLDRARCGSRAVRPS
ncbi:hypothetical protein FBZ93_12292 [Bradyrhizobium macuxiense]|uniref:Uncharacterized protein n=1 Tax=Bradyrhizobium macuxiense TaxID=1755647 RepID=A0A560KVN9_9BRAD|nr:hypothetical protein FBZ93_12292 [Bradyrhizobium macuxiense]